MEFFKFFHKSDTTPPLEEGSDTNPNDVAIAAKLDALVKGLDELSGLVQSKFDAIHTRFEAVEATIRKTEASMRGAVIGIAYGDPPAPSVRSDKPGRLPPLLDTGMAGFGNPS